MKLRIGTEIFHVRAEEMPIKKRLIKTVRPNRIPVFIFKTAQTKYIKAVWKREMLTKIATAGRS